jgi:signal transduction histidine kinase
MSDSAMPPGERPRLLIVDDQPINIQTLYRIFQADHEVFMATSGEQALAFCRDTPLPDLILLDVVMPGLDGLETCRRLKADPATRDIPVIFVTAQSDPADETRALEAGGVDFIAKPVTPAVVRARVRTHLTLKAQNEHLEELVAARTAALSIAKEAAEAANRAKTVFLATMSHELRTPLNGIIGCTALAARLAADPKLKGYLTRIDESSQKLLTMIDDILDFSRVEGARLALEPRPFRLGDTLEEVERLTRPQAAAKGLAFACDLPADLAALTLRGDPLRLEQILLNLAGNAVKFTATGDIGVRVARLASDDARHVLLRFEVRDTGIGIADADRERIFNSFEQADGALNRKYGGMGIGLSIARRLVELMGGEMGVDSATGPGSCFWFTVRLEQA